MPDNQLLYAALYGAVQKRKKKTTHEVDWYHHQLDWVEFVEADTTKTRNSSRKRYSERELYDDIVYALYEIKKEKKTINIPQHS